MTTRAKVIWGSLLALLIAGVIVFLLGPVLFASIAYPLPDKYKGSIAKWSAEYCGGIEQPQHLVSALIMVESGWKETARSGAGAIGMTQFIPSTAVAVAKRLGVSPFTPSDLTKDSDLSIRFGAHYICTRIKDYGGNVKQGLIAYNGGGGAVNAYNAGSPVRGTVGYADKVMAIQRAYANIYGDWWKAAEFGGTPDAEATQQFEVFPKTETSVVGNVSIVDFWRGLLSNQDTSSSEEAAGVNTLWQIFLPGQ